MQRQTDQTRLGSHHREYFANSGAHQCCDVLSMGHLSLLRGTWPCPSPGMSSSPSPWPRCQPGGDQPEGQSSFPRTSSGAAGLFRPCSIHAPPVTFSFSEAAWLGPVISEEILEMRWELKLEFALGLNVAGFAKVTAIYSIKEGQSLSLSSVFPACPSQLFIEAFLLLFMQSFLETSHHELSRPPKC